VEILQTFFNHGGPTTSSTRSECADASGAKLSQLPLLHGVGQYGDQHPGTRGSGFLGQPQIWPRPGPLEGEGQQSMGESVRTGF
jgi:hypothetical protein